MAVSLGELVVQLKGDSVQLRRDLDKLSRDIRGKIGKPLEESHFNARKLRNAFLAVSAAGAALGFAAKKVFDLGASVAETESKFRTVFGNATAAAQEFVDNFGTMAGLSRREAQDLVATTGAIAQGMGFAEAQSERFAEAVTRVAGDLASFNNLPTADTLTRIQAALTGERESLKRLGIVILETDVQQRALINTGKENARQLTQQEKATATLQLITERAGRAIGDLERTQDSAANQAKALGAQVRNIAEDFSTAMLPALQSVLPLLREIATAAAPAANKLAELAVTMLDFLGVTTAEVRTELQRISSLSQDFLKKEGIDEIRRMGEELASTRQQLKELGTEMARTGTGGMQNLLDQQRDLTNTAAGLEAGLGALSIRLQNLRATAERGSVLDSLAPEPDKTAALAAFVATFGELERGVKDIQEPIANLSDVLRGPIQAFGERTGSQMLSDIAKGARDDQAELEGEVKGLVEELGEKVGGDMKEVGADAGEQLVRGIIQGTNNFGDLLKRTISRLIQNSIIGVFRSALGIFSPSKVMEAFGQQTIEGFNQGMRNTISPLRETSAVMARTPAMAAASAASVQAPAFNINADFSRVPAPITPREAALSAEFQELFRETLLQLEQGGFRAG